MRVFYDGEIFTTPGYGGVNLVFEELAAGLADEPAVEDEGASERGPEVDVESELASIKEEVEPRRSRFGSGDVGEGTDEEGSERVDTDEEERASTDTAVEGDAGEETTGERNAERERDRSEAKTGDDDSRDGDDTADPDSDDLGTDR